MQHVETKPRLPLGLEIQSPLEVSDLLGCLKPHGNHLLLPSLRDSMKVGCLPSSGITRPPRYFTPLPLLARLTRISVTLIPSHRGHHPRRTRSPALPITTSPTCRPDDPGEPICFRPGYSTDGTGLPLLTTGSALSISKLRGSMGSLVVRPASLRSSPFGKFSRST